MFKSFHKDFGELFIEDKFNYSFSNTNGFCYKCFSNNDLIFIFDIELPLEKYDFSEKFNSNNILFFNTNLLIDNAIKNNNILFEKIELELKSIPKITKKAFCYKKLLQKQNIDI